MKLKILIADEGPVSRSILKSSLLQWGCEVVAVEDGKKACTALLAGDIDLCILSWNTPELNGLEICHWIRQAGLHKTPYTILMTEDPQPQEMSAAYLAGADDFLTKPLRLKEVRERARLVATKTAQVRSMHAQLRRMDPLECYRLDLALHGKVQH
ncbi:MAG TPA: response regulator [Candidatus Angelobacter sp.]